MTPVVTNPQIALPPPAEFLAGSRAQRTVVVVAHPDDETVGFGALLPQLREATFVYLTDGAPRNLVDARRAGFADWHSYAQARKRELEAAFAIAGIDPGRAVFLDLPDQQAAEHVYWLTRRLHQLLRQTGTVQVLTHAYEGGHPDHDAAAFAVHWACRLLAREERTAPLVVEAPYYHNRAGRVAMGEFLPPAGDAVRIRRLSDEEQAFKRRLVECFVTQAPGLPEFPLDRESLRPAPPHEFDRPPHAGPLLYELLGWEMTGPRWRELARSACRRLGFHAPRAEAIP